MTLGEIEPGIYVNQIWHRRNYPAVNEFTYKSSSIWLDPDDPETALEGIPFSGRSRWNPICFRANDHLGRTYKSLRAQATAEMSKAGINTEGMTLRLLTQPRLWGWLFNPISIYLFFDELVPAACLLEVTNTPWKESHLYAVELRNDGNSFVANFAKKLHVSPFLGMDYNYKLTVDNQNLQVDIDVLDEANDVILNTAIGGFNESERVTGLFTNAGSTHKTSAAIHWQALKLVKKRVRFNAHPNK